MIIYLFLLLIYFLDSFVANFVWYSEDFSSSFFINFVTKIGSFKVIALLNLLLLLYFYKKKLNIKKSLLIVGIKAQVISSFAIQILKYIYGRARPYYFFHNKYKKNGFIFFSYGNDFSSFPSGHSAGIWAFIICMLFIFKDNKYIKFLPIIGVIVSFSRILLSVHYLSDVIVGGIIGSLTIYCMMNNYIQNELVDIIKN